MTTHDIDIEQEHTDFEMWCHTRSLDIGRDDKGDYISLETYLSWEGYQAGRAALQSQDREDAERLDWLLRKLPGDAIRYCVGDLADTADIDEFRAAIDHARRIEEEI